MADFKAVLRKTLDGLGETTPEVREKVYEKARVAIRKKLDAIDPKPAQALIDRQMNSLEESIKEIESDYQVATEPLDDLDRILGGTTNGTSTPEEADIPPASDRDDTVTPVMETDAEDPAVETMGRIQAKRKSRKGLWVFLILLVAVGVAAASWIRNDLVEQYTGFDPKAFVASLTESTESAVDGEAPADPEPQEEEKPAEQSESQSSEQPRDTTEETPAADTAEQKFTQRLTEDGTEIDPGPAEGEAAVGEGTSVAEAQPGEQPASSGENTAQSTDPETASDGTNSSEAPSVVVGQKALLYEEGSGTERGTADAGGVVWSVVSESPGNGLPEEPAIRGDLTIPEKGISLSITIRRNGDDTLPASHLVELFFQLPGGYGGGGIAELTRISMKDTEQATGAPLLGVPARISDEFYLVALTEADAAIETNLTLLRRQSWIDIPVSYLSGRRALFTLEKGVPGERVFNEVLKAWADAESG